MDDQPSRSTLTDAAAALEAELGRFEALAAGLARESLSTEKQLRRATRVLQDLQTSEARLAEHVQALVAAIGGAHERQRQHADRVRARAEEICARNDQLAELLERLRRVGERSAEMTALAQSLAARRDEAGGADAVAEGLSTLHERLREVADEAGAVAEAAAQAEFVELGRQAAGLREQLLGSRNALGRILRG